MTSLFIKMLSISITASWIVLAVILLRFALRRAPKWLHCVLWVIVALRLLLPVVPQSRISLIPRDLTVQQTVQTETVQQTVQPEQPADDSAAVIEEPADPQSHILQILSRAWIGGVGIMLLYGAVTYWRLRWQVRVALRQDGNVYICDQIYTPFVLGVFRPRIYVPSGIEKDRLQHILAHENAHIRRKDHWWKPLGFVLLAVYWFNPVLWLGYVLLCRDIECACDEKVVAQMDDREKKQYSETLLVCSIHRRMVLACPVAFGEIAVKDRIKGVLNYKKPAFWIVAVSVVTCAVMAVCFLTDPKTCIHAYTGQITVQSTCTHQGTEQFTCTKCDHSYTAPLPLIAHSYDEGIVTRTSTCSEPGNMCFTCTDCGAVKTQALATNDVHELKETITKAPTCTHGGEGVLACVHCSYSEACAYPQHTHDFEDYGLVNKDCYEHKRKRICVRCGLVETIYLNDYGHTWSDGRCTICRAFESGWPPTEWPEAAEWQKKRNEGKLPNLDCFPN